MTLGTVLGVAACSGTYPTFATCTVNGPGWVSYNVPNGTATKQVTSVIVCLDASGGRPSFVVTYPNGVITEIRGEIGYVKNKPSATP